MTDLDRDPEKLADQLLAAGAAEADSLDELRLCRRYEAALEEQQQDQRRELPSWADPHDLAQSGWGVIFARDESPAIEAALRPLVERRQDQAGELYQRLFRKPRESGERFLRRYGETPGVVRPEVLPYYLLIVGGPETIPWKFQYELSVNHAVGRLAFSDAAAYGRYAAAVVEAETRGVGRPRRASLFSVERDGVTQLLASHLAAPLQEKWPRLGSGWELDLRRRDEATKDGLRRLLSGGDGPGLLLASCHGLQAAPGAPGQEAVQGSLVCQDRGYFSGADVDGCRLAGLTVMTFACYGAGTPVRDNFPEETAGKGPPAIALRPFVARLPQEMLSRGALAVVGHVDRGWTYSFAWPGGDRGLTAAASLDDVLYRLLRGDRLGHAMRPLCQRYKALAAELAKDLELHKSHPQLASSAKAKERLAFKWTVHNDARNFVILGDPAVYALGRRTDARPWMERATPRPSRRPRRPAPAVDEAPPARRPAASPDLELYVAQSRGDGEPVLTYQLTAHDPELGFNRKEFGPVTLRKDPRHVVDQFFEELAELAPDTPEAAGEARERVAGGGALLASELLPGELRQALEGLRHAEEVRTLLIQSRDDWIPWELLKLGDGPFLCEAFAVTRWQAGLGLDGRTHLPLRKLAVLAPRDSELDAAAEEYAEIAGLFTKARRGVREIASKFNSVVSELGRGAYDGWHFAGHGLAAGERDPNFWTIALEDGGRLQPKDLWNKAAGFGRARPLVFFNGCQTGLAAASLAGLGGWAAQWMKLGAGAFVGTSWFVRDAPAAFFAQTFYAEFLAGATFGEAVRRARMRVRERFPGDPAWLTYVAYGHPGARCARPPRRFLRPLLAAAAALLIVLLSIGLFESWQHRRFVRHVDRGVELLESGDLEGAAGEFRSAARLEPDAAQAHDNLGAVHAAQGRYPEALEAYAEAIALAPDVARYRFNRGSLLLHLERAEEAVAELERAVELDPRYAEAYNELGRAYLRLGYLDDARETLERGLQGRSPTANTAGVLRKNLGKVLLEQGSPGAAVDELRRALSELDRDDLESRREATYLLARSHGELGEVDEACSTLRRYHDLDGYLIASPAPAVRELAGNLGCPLEGGE